MPTTSIRLSKAVEEFLQIQEARRAKSTVVVDRTVLNMFVRGVGDRILSNLKPEHIEQWFYGKGGLMDHHKIMGGRTRPPLSALSHNQYRMRLGIFFTFARRRNYISDRVDLLERVQTLKVQANPRLRPGAATLLEMIEATDYPRDRAFIAVTVNTALRASDVTELRVGDVDLVDMWISTRIRKTGNVDEKPITADLAEELTRWLKAYAEEIGRELKDEDYLFPARSGGLISHYEEDEYGNKYQVRTNYVLHPDRPITKGSQLIVQRSLKKVGLPTSREGVHTLRRAAARNYYDWICDTQGESAALRETAALLNHKNTTTTEIYLGLTVEKERRDRRLRNKGFLTDIAKRQATESASGDVIELRPIALGE